MPTKTIPPALIAEDRTQTIHRITGPNGSESVWRYSLLPGSDTYEENPQWREQIARGENATTSRNATRYKVLVWQPAKAVIVRGDWTQKCSTSVIMGSLSSVSHDLNAIDTIAIKKALKGVTTFDGGTFLGEIRETLGLIQGRSQSLLSQVIGLHKKQSHARQRLWRDPNRLSKRLSQNWLEAVFGWAPLIQDINDLYAVLQKKFSESTRIAVRASAKSDKMDSVQGTHYGVNFEKVKLTQSVLARVRISYTGEVEPIIQTNADLASQLGLFPDTVFLTAWELLPYSFLIDYFSNIGDLLELQVLINRVKLVWLSKSIKYEELNLNMLEHVPHQPGDLITNKQIGQALIKKEKIVRSKPASFQLPTLEFSADVSLKQVLNIAALTRLRLDDLRWKPGVF